MNGLTRVLKLLVLVAVTVMVNKKNQGFMKFSNNWFRALTTTIFCGYIAIIKI